MFNRAIKLENFYQRYDWGTQSEIPDLLGLAHPGGDEPLAEYWVGAHPGLPSKIDTGEFLNEVIHQYPKELLGDHHAELNSRLPYLFKVLSAGRALSIQVHPNKQQAQAGYQAERARGIGPDAPNCNYKDDNHKPELLYALTPFKAMVGFRPLQMLEDLLSQSSLDFFSYYLEKIKKDGQAVLAELYKDLLYLEKAELSTLCNDLLEFCRARSGEPWQTIIDLHDIYGDDPGVCFPLLLNVLTLEPGQAVFLGAGIPHAYLRGTGLEVMANSDNVLRGGLTKKYMDREELIRITEFKPLDNPIQIGSQQGARLCFNIPCPDFQFEILQVSADESVTLGDSGSAELIFVLEGEAVTEKQNFKKSESYLLPANLSKIHCQGTMKLARVTTKL
jgi:mannose-6-phosphate isomerase